MIRLFANNEKAEERLLRDLFRWLKKGDPLQIIQASIHRYPIYRKKLENLIYTSDIYTDWRTVTTRNVSAFVEFFPENLHIIEEAN